jgi:hypothetical protein|nr:MAG TPA: hypothetical protein [Caudoviricetes sp.]
MNIVENIIEKGLFVIGGALLGLIISKKVYDVNSDAYINDMANIQCKLDEIDSKVQVIYDRK